MNARLEQIVIALRREIARIEGGGDVDCYANYCGEMDHGLSIDEAIGNAAPIRDDDDEWHPDVEQCEWGVTVSVEVASTVRRRGMPEVIDYVLSEPGTEEKENKLLGECGNLESATRRAREAIGNGESVLIVGPPKSGKTRLALSTVNMLEEDSPFVVADPDWCMYQFQQATYRARGGIMPFDEVTRFRKDVLDWLRWSGPVIQQVIPVMTCLDCHPHFRDGLIDVVVNLRAET